jgi:hypothetical protein
MIKISQVVSDSLCGCTKLDFVHDARAAIIGVGYADVGP